MSGQGRGYEEEIKKDRNENCRVGHAGKIATAASGWLIVP
jgi:hypothetical protein